VDHLKNENKEILTIGQRASKAIQEKAKNNGNWIYVECEKIGVSRKVYRDWRKCGFNPTAYFLQQMALNGYDIYWILTGEMKNENK
jgi:hypothetical protein